MQFAVYISYLNLHCKPPSGNQIGISKGIRYASKTSESTYRRIRCFI